MPTQAMKAKKDAYKKKHGKKPPAGLVQQWQQEVYRGAAKERARKNQMKINK